MSLSLASLCFSAPALAQNVSVYSDTSAVQLSPVPQSNQNLDTYQSLNQEGSPLSVSLRMAESPEPARVFHPNGKGKLSDLFSPYNYQNVVNTQLFYLSVRNNEGQVLPADNLKIQVSFNGLPYSYLDAKSLKKHM